MIRLFILMFLASACGGSVVEGLGCPTGFIFVPRNSNYVEEAFCVAKFEMKNDGAGVAVSQAAGQPWASINRANAITECQNLGTGYDLITNAQWQTIARNIEAQAQNWSSNQVGLGFLNEGHSDASPGATLAIADETDPFNGTGQTNGDQKRTHVLSNNQTIWDFSGNVWEWVKDDNATNYGVDAFFYQITDITHPNAGTLNDGVSRRVKSQFGPLGDYTSLSTTPFGHLGRAFISTVNGGVVRGGSYIDYATNAATNEEGGIFSVNTQYSVLATEARIGYRCVYQP